MVCIACSTVWLTSEQANTEQNRIEEKRREEKREAHVCLVCGPIAVHFLCHGGPVVTITRVLVCVEREQM